MNLLGDEPSILLYFTPNLHTAKAPYEELCLWDDPTFIPKFVNNKKDAPRVGKSWGWNFYLTSD